MGTWPRSYAHGQPLRATTRRIRPVHTQRCAAAPPPPRSPISKPGPAPSPPPTLPVGREVQRDVSSQNQPGGRCSEGGAPQQHRWWYRKPVRRRTHARRHNETLFSAQPPQRPSHRPIPCPKHAASAEPCDSTPPRAAPARQRAAARCAPSHRPVEHPGPADCADCPPQCLGSRTALPVPPARRPPALASSARRSTRAASGRRESPAAARATGRNTRRAWSRPATVLRAARSAARRLRWAGIAPPLGQEGAAHLHHLGALLNAALRRPGSCAPV